MRKSIVQLGTILGTNISHEVPPDNFFLHHGYRWLFISGVPEEIVNWFVLRGHAV